MHVRTCNRGKEKKSSSTQKERLAAHNAAGRSWLGKEPPESVFESAQNCKLMILDLSSFTRSVDLAICKNLIKPFSFAQPPALCANALRMLYISPPLFEQFVANLAYHGHVSKFSPGTSSTGQPSDVQLHASRSCNDTFGQLDRALAGYALAERSPGFVDHQRSIEAGVCFEAKAAYVPFKSGNVTARPFLFQLIFFVCLHQNICKTVLCFVHN